MTRKQKRNKVGRPKATVQTTQVTFRFSNELLDRVDAYVNQMQHETPGITITRADAVRVLLLRALKKRCVSQIRNESYYCTIFIIQYHHRALRMSHTSQPALRGIFAVDFKMSWYSL